MPRCPRRRSTRIRFHPRREMILMMVGYSAADNSRQKVASSVKVLRAQTSINILCDHLGSRENVQGRCTSRYLLHPLTLAIIEVGGGRACIHLGGAVLGVIDIAVQDV